MRARTTQQSVRATDLAGHAGRDLVEIVRIAGDHKAVEREQLQAAVVSGDGLCQQRERRPRTRQLGSGP